jgi:Zn/Cd-binding protein ZinT
MKGNTMSEEMSEEKSQEEKLSGPEAVAKDGSVVQASEQPTQVKENPFSNISKSVKQIVEQNLKSGSLLESVIETIAQEKIAGHAATLVAAVKKQDVLRRDVSKIKPDLVSFDENGKKVSEFYSQANQKTLREAKEKLDKFEKAFQKALNSGDFNELENLAK